MSLLLTKTCEYAILVSIQQGRYFPIKQEYKIETELDLKLPPSIDDLIPTKTILYSPVQKVDLNGTITFNISLVYFVSFKQLQRLRRTDATTTLTIKRVNNQQHQQQDKIYFNLSQAKEVIPQSQHKLDQIYKFVSDKGAWYTISNNKQFKVGLFYVAMPDNNNNNNNSSGGSIISSTPCIQLRSPPPTPIMTKRLNVASNRKKKITSILGSASTITTTTATSSTTTTTSSTATRKKKELVTSTTIKPTLRRTKSSLVDLNIEQLADVLAKINIFSSQTPPPPVPPIPPQIPTTTSYHQIGKGSSEYTFYFKIIFVDNQILLAQSTSRKIIQQLKKPFFSWSFLTSYNLVPASSISITSNSKSCFQLRGHLSDIKNWLNAQESIQLSYIIMDKYTKETVGKAKVPLVCNDDDDKLYPVYSCDNEQKVVAKVTIRIGLKNGWYKDEDIVMASNIAAAAAAAAVEQQQHGKRLSKMDDPWDTFLFQQQQQQGNKKSRHYSQSSSVPTLLTSSTTSSTTKSATNTSIPSIHYIRPLPTSSNNNKKSSISSSKYSSLFNKK